MGIRPRRRRPIRFSTVVFRPTSRRLLLKRNVSHRLLVSPKRLFFYRLLFVRRVRGIASLGPSSGYFLRRRRRRCRCRRRWCRMFVSRVHHQFLLCFSPLLYYELHRRRRRRRRLKKKLLRTPSPLDFSRASRVLFVNSPPSLSSSSSRLNLALTLPRLGLFHLFQFLLVQS